MKKSFEESPAEWIGWLWSAFTYNDDGSCIYVVGFTNTDFLDINILDFVISTLNWTLRKRPRRKSIYSVQHLFVLLISSEKNCARGKFMLLYCFIPLLYKVLYFWYDYIVTCCCPWFLPVSFFLISRMFCSNYTKIHNFNSSSNFSDCDFF